MRTTLKQTLATMAALGALLIAGNACTDHDDLRNPAGTQLLALGEVNIAGAQTATADTRAAITEDPATGFTGIRKSTFKAGDELKLTLTDGKGGAPVDVTATLDGTANTWTMDRTYYAASTTLSATYTPAAQPGSLKHKDVLTTDPANPVDLKADGNKQKLTLAHANAMLEITPPAGIKADYTISVKATPTNDPANPGNPGSEETLTTVAEEDAGSVIRYRTIALPGKVTTITLTTTDHSMVYTATLATELTVEANKRYPIALTLTPDGLTATVNSIAGDLNWGAGGESNGRPAGYTYYISTPEELAQFAADVNSVTTDEAKTSMVAIQTADIDLSQLKTATGSYTYTATATQWVPIGTSDDGTSKNYFKGKYNGNGHTISNLKINESDLLFLGLFGGTSGAKITGVHLRNCTIKSTGKDNLRAGTLIGGAGASIVALCSATGSIEVSGNISWVGGIVGYAGSGTASNPYNYFTRCSADVAVSRNSSDSGVVGGFAGYSTDTYYAGCIASGKVYKSGGGISSGFSSGNTTPTYHAYHCITNSEIVNGNGDATSAFGNINFAKSCLATQMSYGVFGTVKLLGDNVCLGTHSTVNIDGAPVGGNHIHASVPVADVYTKLTTKGVADTDEYKTIKTLHWSKEDGHTFDVVENKWYALDAWQNNGATALPTLNMAYEGSPAPIVDNNKVYMVNGYYVTAPGGETADYTWAASNDAPAMTPDPCAAGASNGWHLPTMKEFEEMAGWEVTNPWSQSSLTVVEHFIVDAANFIKAFPNDKTYWSSVVSEKYPEGVWAIRANTSTQAYYTSYGKSTTRCRVRCVQKQILTR